jgi:3-dehydroquinate synthase
MSKTISVKTKGFAPYDIKIEKGILPFVGNMVRPLTKAKKVAIITDSVVAPLYLKTVIDSFKAADFEVYSFSFTAGEPSKTLDTVSKMLEFFCMHGLTRKDLAVALGGGVVGDLVGFASAIYLRGIDFVQVPTTLLAQVDSSVGGKTGCDLPFGKNLCGAFHNPLGVFIDPDTLKTLPDKFLRDGYSEAIKSGAILVPELFELFENSTPETLDIEKVIYLSVKMKAEVVENDFTEQGNRAFLNFGHTLGHAIEKYENFCGMTHGAAVAVGMCLITGSAQKAGLTEKGTLNRLANCLEKYGLDTGTDISVEDLVLLSKNDKKSLSEGIKLVLIEKIGSAFTKVVPWDKLLDFFKNGVL